MALELERRFFVKGDRWREFAGEARQLRQGYLVIASNGLIVRVRIHAEFQAWLTIKSPAEGIAQHEFEYMIPILDAEALWGLSINRLVKTRYELNMGGGEWVVDCFEGLNAPLVLAEVEVSSLSDPLEIPTWCAQEVTGEALLSNASLSRHPISKWSSELRQRIPS